MVMGATNICRPVGARLSRECRSPCINATFGQGRMKSDVLTSWTSVRLMRLPCMHALTLDEVHGLVKTRPQVDTCLQLAV